MTTSSVPASAISSSGSPPKGATRTNPPGTAAKALALSLVDLLQNPEALAEAKADFQERMQDRKYSTKIPKGEKAPQSIR